MPLSNLENTFATTFHTVAQAPGGVARLRELILTLAVQGKLVAQDASDEPASALLKKIRAEKDRLIAEGKIKKDKPLAEITEEEKSFELPLGWAFERLGEVCQLNYGKNLPTSSLLDEGFDVFGANGIIGKYSKFIYEKRKLLISCRGAYSGKANISPEKCFVTNNSIVCDFYAGDCMDINYFHAQVTVADKSKIVTGSAQPQVTIANLSPLVISIPPANEQSRIVARVEELMRLCDALEEKGPLAHTQHQQLLQAMLDSLTQTTDAAELARHWQRLAQHFDLLIDRPEAVDALEQTILQLAVRGLLVPQDPSDEPASELLKKIRAEKDRLIAEGKIKKDKPLPAIGEDEKSFELPLGWSWVGLRDICSIAGGATPSKSNPKYWIGDIPWVSPKDMKIEKLLDSQDHISEEALQGSLALIPQGSLLMVVRGMILAHSFPVAENSVPVAINQDMKAATPYFYEVMPFLSLLMAGMRKDILSRVERSTHGTCKLESPKLFGMRFPFPPLAEQSRIVARVTELRALCQQLREKLTQARHTQTQLAQAWVEQVAV